jgi:hypothetical protein
MLRARGFLTQLSCAPARPRSGQGDSMQQFADAARRDGVTDPSLTRYGFTRTLVNRGLMSCAGG